MSKQPLRLGGVPEHFNLPFHLVLEEGALVPFTWQDYPSGTGPLCRALDADELDVALVLTEGVVAHRARGSKVEVPGFWVETPLIWGIHTGADSPYKTLSDLDGKPFAISRQGSGSQLMAYLLARQEEWPPHKVSFHEVGGLDGAVKALTAGEAAGFLWERFMTHPLVASGKLRRLGQLPTPWPAFAVAVRPQVWEERQDEVRHLIQNALSRAEKFSKDPKAPDLISARYGLEPTQAQEWLQLTRWAWPWTEGIGLVLDEVEVVLRAVGAL